MPKPTMKGTAYRAAATQQQFIAVGHDTTPFVSVYKWDSTNGFVSKYSDPGTAAAGNTERVAFSPSEDTIALASITSPYLSIYVWTAANGFGNKYNSPGTGGVTALGGSARDVIWNPAGTKLGCTGPSPYVHVYDWSVSANGLGTKATAASTPAGSSITAYCVNWNRTGTAIGVGYGGSGGSLNVSVWPWSDSTGFGTRYTGPGTAPGGQMNAIEWSPNNDYVCVSGFVSPYNNLYPWSDSTGFGTRATITNSVGTTIRDTKWSKTGQWMASVTVTTPFLHVHTWDSTNLLGTKSTPSTVPATGGCYGVDFSMDDDAIAVAINGTPYVEVYRWSSSGFGTKYNNPGTLPAGLGNDVVFGRA